MPCSALLQTPGAVITAVAGRDADRSLAFAATFAARQGSPIAGLASYDELMARDDVDGE